MFAEPGPWTDDIASIGDLAAAGLGRRTIRGRIRRGAWAEPLPGIACRTTGSLTHEQWLAAALAYGGPQAVLSHETAGSFWGLTKSSGLHITLPHGVHKRSTAEVTVHQTVRWFEPQYVEILPLTPPARTVIDICLGLSDLDHVRNVMGRAVQRELTTASALGQELELAPSRGSLFPRRALEEVTLNAHGASEARLARLVIDGSLPMPEFNAAVTTDQGVKYIDGLWRSMGKGVEVDGRRYHLDPQSWAADLRRQNAIQSAGIVLLRITAERLWTDPAGVLAELRVFLRSAGGPTA